LARTHLPPLGPLALPHSLLGRGPAHLGQQLPPTLPQSLTARSRMSARSSPTSRSERRSSRNRPRAHDLRAWERPAPLPLQKGSRNPLHRLPLLFFPFQPHSIEHTKPRSGASPEHHSATPSVFAPSCLDSGCPLGEHPRVLLFLPVPLPWRLVVSRAVLRELRRALPWPAMAGGPRAFPRPR
jgi:hypothetical protein